MAFRAGVPITTDAFGSLFGLGFWGWIGVTRHERVSVCKRRQVGLLQTPRIHPSLQSIRNNVPLVTDGRIVGPVGQAGPI